MKTDNSCRKGPKKTKNEVLRRCHPDKFNGKVLDKGMREKNTQRNSTYQQAYAGLVEWHEHALEWKNKEEIWLEKWQQGLPLIEFQFLETFEMKFDVKGASMNSTVYQDHMGEEYEKYKLGKRKRRKNEDNNQKGRKVPRR